MDSRESGRSREGARRQPLTPFFIEAQLPIEGRKPTVWPLPPPDGRAVLVRAVDGNGAAGRQRHALRADRLTLVGEVRYAEEHV